MAYRVWARCAAARHTVSMGLALALFHIPGFSPSLGFSHIPGFSPSLGFSHIPGFSPSPVPHPWKTYSRGAPGTSYCTMWVTSGKSSPRAATSVHSSTAWGVCTHTHTYNQEGHISVQPGLSGLMRGTTSVHSSTAWGVCAHIGGACLTDMISIQPWLSVLVRGTTSVHSSSAWGATLMRGTMCVHSTP
jgi:hypothetical protein